MGIVCILDDLDMAFPFVRMLISMDIRIVTMRGHSPRPVALCSHPDHSQTALPLSFGTTLQQQR